MIGYRLLSISTKTLAARGVGFRRCCFVRGGVQLTLARILLLELVARLDAVLLATRIVRRAARTVGSQVGAHQSDLGAATHRRAGRAAARTRVVGAVLLVIVPSASEYSLNECLQN